MESNPCIKLTSIQWKCEWDQDGTRKSAREREAAIKAINADDGHTIWWIVTTIQNVMTIISIEHEHFTI